MPREEALDPVVTRSGTTKLAVPPVARVTDIPLDPVCRTFVSAGGQTVTPDVAE